MWIILILCLLCVPVAYRRLSEKRTERFQDRDH
jgi:hypothetical protein